MITEANEHNPSIKQAYDAWKEQFAKGETMGVIQMYEDAYLEARTRELHKPVRTLECNCCGGRTRGRQWHNRDIGYGMCTDCIAHVRAKGMPESEIQDLYGFEAVHWGIPE